MYIYIAELFIFVICKPSRFDAGTEEDGMKRYTDIPYGKEDRQKLDLYLPDRYREEGLILFIHGGAWLSGDKKSWKPYMEKCVEDGYAAAAVNYRYISETIHMDALMDDMDKAVRTIRETAEKNEVRLTKMLLTGISAGAHMALLYAYTALDKAAIKPVGVIDFCGPADLTDPGMVYGNQIGDPNVMMGFMNKVCGTDFTPESAVYAMPYLKKYSPVEYVTRETPPTIICHGQMDYAVPFSVAVKLRDKLEENFVEYRFVPMPYSGHELGQKGPDISASALFRAFADRYLRGKRGK